jgi:hypothetical protein
MHRPSLLSLLSPTSIRLGFATNSSSTHSILLVAPADVERIRAQREQGSSREEIAVKDEDGDTEYTRSVVDGWGKANRGWYQWDWFALTEREEKLDYLWTDLYGQIKGMLRIPYTFRFYQLEQAGLGTLPDLEAGRSVFAAALASRILEHEPAPFEEDDPSIDHDSAFSFPIDPETGFPHVSFARWFRDRLLVPNAVILGGNDNEEGPDKPAGQNLRHPLTDDEYGDGSMLSVYDRDDHWLLWQKSDGTKIRVPKVDGDAVLFSRIPELADIKITSKCGMQCLFCYQGSTPDGEHPTLTAYDMASVIAGLGVREVAIGGGEPLEHPDFWQLVNQLRGGVVVNVTTRRLDLIPFWKLDELGGIGFSTESAAAARRALERLGLFDEEAYANPWQKKLVLHVVLGAAPMSEILDLMRLAKEARIPVLFLAYKTDGRGQAFSPHPHDDWIEQVKTAFALERGYWDGPRLGVDTPIVERWGPAIEAELRVDPRLMSYGEGKFSLYVDFVAQTFAKASYGDIERVSFATSDKYVDGKKLTDRILEGFRGWNA